MDSVKPLEAALSSLLSSVREDPWSLLIIQTLLWSFRRWAIFYLTSDELTTSMREFLWETHLDLVDQHAPAGLRDFALVWLNPDNVGDRQDTLEELNAYFLRLIDCFDHALRQNDEDEQNALADFIDERITVVLDRWLEGKPQYRIYPTAEESPDVFATNKIYAIMQNILDTFTSGKPFRPVSAPLAAAPVQPESAPEPPVSVPEPILASPPEPEAKTVREAIQQHTRKVKHRSSANPTRKTHAKTRGS
jgi:hypothetical protein